MTKKIKLAILEKAKLLIENGRERYTCVAIGEAMVDYLGHYVGSNRVVDYIPEYTRENAIEICEKYGIEFDTSFKSIWFRYGIKNENRIAYLDAFIKEFDNGNL